jgi:hypothetical protein
MNLALEARKLADYIQELNLTSGQENNIHDSYEHIGALYTNIVLQAGLNYRTVVEPRVKHVLNKYPKADTVSGFLKAIDNDGIENVISWKHPDKIGRMHELLDFSKEMYIDTCEDLSEFLSHDSNHDIFLGIRGVGNKTLDYTLKLLAFDTIAVDRHIYSFIEEAGLTVINYRITKKVVEFAADILNVPRSTMDHQIWTYMSEKGRKQINIQFLKRETEGIGITEGI